MIRLFKVDDHTIRIREDGSTWILEIDDVPLPGRHATPAAAWRSAVDRILWRRPPPTAPRAPEARSR